MEEEVDFFAVKVAERLETLMTTKKRNHYVPRFLLNNFASRSRDGKKHWVWQYRKGEAPKEVSTRDVAVSAFFYGRDSAVEEALAQVEQRIKPVIDLIVAGEPAARFASELATFAYLLAVRTRALRFQMADSAREVAIELFGKEILPLIETALRKQAEQLYDTEVEKIVKSLPRSQRKMASKLVQQRLPKTRFMEMAETYLARLNITAILGLLGQQVTSIDFETAAEEGQLKGLERLLEANKTPDSLLNASWKVLTEDVQTSYILGDTCVLATNEGKEWGSLLRFGHVDWIELYLPLTPRHLLVAQRQEHAVSLTCQQVNEYSAQLAENTIFSSARTERVDRLGKSIGTGSAIINRTETTRMVEEMWQELSL